MSVAETCWLAAASAVFLIGALALLMRLHCRARAKRDAIKSEPLVPQEVRTAAHDLANESHKLRAGLRRLANSPDPIAALVEAIHSAYFNGRDNNNNKDGEHK